MSEPARRALAFWVLRVAVAFVLAAAIQAWRGPDPFLWWLALGYAALSALTTWMILRTRR
ncbi:hypothetical protein [Jannaschia sp. W003]|uniref:hypothetical protein n=1 Tax=Jannaschia sp. W003 TaxID=2867012 RepID=UPI0021A77136|nr:hypothetical protein [Jannaschia sp. W003]UWQ21701.1 hypothetical protein K3554_01325 [Jannaschia sp. W003]